MGIPLRTLAMKSLRIQLKPMITGELMGKTRPCREITLALLHGLDATAGLHFGIMSHGNNACIVHV